MDHYVPKNQSLKADKHVYINWRLENHCVSNSGSLDQDHFLSTSDLLEDLYCSTKK